MDILCMYVYIPLIPLLKENISNQFLALTLLVHSVFFNPRQVPASKTSYWNETPLLSMEVTTSCELGWDQLCPRIISTEVSTEWKTYLPLLSKQNGDESVKHPPIHYPFLTATSANILSNIQSKYTNHKISPTTLINTQIPTYHSLFISHVLGFSLHIGSQNVCGCEDGS